MNIKEYLKNNILYLDGGMGTLLQERGLRPGELPELWNISHPEIISGVHAAYFDAGANVVNTNTFGANSFKFDDDTLENIIKAAIFNARKGAEMSAAKSEKFVALDIGPTGKMLKPYGDLDFEDATSVFAKIVKLGAKYGADLIFIETMNDCLETKAALLAAKENSKLPVFVSNAYGEDGKLMTGASPEAMVAMLEGMGADVVGVNCSLGPKQLEPVIERILNCCSVPVMLKPNAGLPKSVDGKTVYDVLPNDFAENVASQIKKGVRIAGGCCGTTPEYIKSLTELTKGFEPAKITPKNISCVSSYTHAVCLGASPVLIGERINPTGKKRFKEALKNNEISYILGEGINQQEKGVHILDVNVGLPEIDEEEMLVKTVTELQAVTNLPLQIDTSNPDAMEKALRRYNGKAMVNSVNGKKESMERIFPLIKKYGGLVVALTLDEDGIPNSAEGRLRVAEKILKTAAEYGIDKKDIVFDPLAMAVSADKEAAAATLEAVRLIKEKLGANTVLGVSNISFGLPERDAINSCFFTAALESGLSAAIMNPYSQRMLASYYSFRALHGLDENFNEYISFMQSTNEAMAVKTAEKTELTLARAIEKGFKEEAENITKELVLTNEPLDIVQSQIIPALDTVGKGFEEKKIYLPQLLMSAEAAQSAFGVIKGKMLASGGETDVKCNFVIATVKGDIHDIGKNIVKLLLENYGFNVTDLGKDVPPETVEKAVIELHAPLVGLSALMTTTVPAMEETIRLLKRSAPWCKAVVGGAVLTQEYADSIGADFYARDAMETVRYAEKINAEL